MVDIHGEGDAIISWQTRRYLADSRGPALSYDLSQMFLKAAAKSEFQLQKLVKAVPIK